MRKKENCCWLFVVFLWFICMFVQKEKSILKLSIENDQHKLYKYTVTAVALFIFLINLNSQKKKLINTSYCLLHLWLLQKENECKKTLGLLELIFVTVISCVMYFISVCVARHRREEKKTVRKRNRAIMKIIPKQRAK